MSDDELGENSVLLESPLDKLEPYQIFRSCLISKFSLWLDYSLYTNATCRVATRTASVLHWPVLTPLSR